VGRTSRAPTTCTGSTPAVVRGVPLRVYSFVSFAYRVDWFRAFGPFLVLSLANRSALEVRTRGIVRIGNLRRTDRLRLYSFDENGRTTGQTTLPPPFSDSSSRGTSPEVATYAVACGQYYGYDGRSAQVWKRAGRAGGSVIKPEAMCSGSRSGFVVASFLAGAFVAMKGVDPRKGGKGSRVFFCREATACLGCARPSFESTAEAAGCLTKDDLPVRFR